MMLLVAAALLVAGITAPHLLDLRRAPAATASTIWVGALTLRALAGVAVAAYLAFVFPATGIFAAATHWCWHTVLPVLATHFGLDGHRLGGLVILLPEVLVIASLVSILWGVAVAKRAVHGLLRTGVAGGPQGSVIVPERDVVLAVAGIGHPQVVVSTGALLVLDDEELAAGLAHEQAHIARRHRWILLYVEFCRGLSALLPGARRAAAELSHHLERDADAWALRRHDRLALAGAICKAALSPASTPVVASLSGGAGVRERLDEILTRDLAARSSRVVALRAFAGGVVVLAFGLALTLPVAVAQAGTAAAPMLRQCLS